MSPNKYKILIADHDQQFLDKIVKFLSLDERVEVVGVAQAPNQIFVMLTKLEPDVILFEPAIPKYDSYKLVRELCVLYDDIIKIALSRYNFPKLVNNTIELGAQGFLWKKKDIPKIFRAIKSIEAGDKFLSQSTQTNQNKASFFTKDDFVKGMLLSFRERDIITLLSRGLTENKIAAKFNTDVEIILKDIDQILEKLSFKSMDQVRYFAIQQGLV